MLTDLSVHMTVFGRCFVGILCIIGLWTAMAQERARGHGSPVARMLAVPFGLVVIALLLLTALDLLPHL
jgi:polyferredoxin